MGAGRGLIEGFGKGLKAFGGTVTEYAKASSLQEEAAKAQALRDERLVNLHEQSQIRAEGRARQPFKDAEAEVAAGKTQMVDDPSGTVRARTDAEIRQHAIETYRKHGLIREAMDMERTELTREEQKQRNLDRVSDNDRQNRQLDEQARHNKALERIQGATQGRMAEVAKLQIEGMKFDLENKRELKGLQDAFAAETDPAKRATLERNILTKLGKAKELPEPVKAYVDTVKAELSAYAKSEADGATLPATAIARRNELQRQMQNLATTGSLNIGAPPVAAAGGRPPLSSFGVVSPAAAPAPRPASAGNDVNAGGVKSALRGNPAPNEFEILNPALQKWRSQ